MNRDNDGKILDEEDKQKYLSSLFRDEFTSSIKIIDDDSTKEIQLPPVQKVPVPKGQPVNINIVYNIDARTQIVNDKRSQTHNEYHSTIAAGDSVINAIGGILGRLFD